MGVYYNKNKCICLPCKIILGKFIEALQMEADTIVMVRHQGVTCWSDFCECYRHLQNYSLQIAKFEILNLKSYGNSSH